MQPSYNRVDKINKSERRLLQSRNRRSVTQKVEQSGSDHRRAMFFVGPAGGRREVARQRGVIELHELPTARRLAEVADPSRVLSEVDADDLLEAVTNRIAFRVARDVRGDMDQNIGREAHDRLATLFVHRFCRASMLDRNLCNAEEGRGLRTVVGRGHSL